MQRRGLVVVGGIVSCLMAFGLNQSGINAAPTQADPAPRAFSCNRGIDLPRSPTHSWSMGQGLGASIWQLHDPDNNVPRLRISAVRAEPGVVRLAPIARVPLMIDPGTVVRSKDVAAVINADFFDTMRFGDAVPQGAVIIDRKPIFIPKGWSAVLVWNALDRPRTTHVALDARVVIGGIDVPVVALNDPLVRGRDISIMNDAWNREQIPDGLAALVVKSGRVVRVHEESKDVRIPRKGFVLVAKDISAFPPVGVDEPAEASIAARASDQQQIVHAAGHGGVSMKERVIIAPCSAYESLLRPRSAVAWNAEGQIWFLASSSGRPDREDGMRHGGTTKEELSRVARSLGADTAVVLDGGGSTALFAKVGDKARRLDMPQDSWVRPVPVVWLMRPGLRAP